MTGAYVKIGFFRTDTDLLYHDEAHGDLFHQVEKTMDLLLTKYLRAGISYRGIHRVEALPVPEDALREAVLNALIHKDYSLGAPIQIKVYPEKLSLWNPGELPDRWTIQNLLGEHSSRPFNPDIANAFFRAGEIEAWGRGIRRIFEACQAAKSPEPKVSCQASDMLVEFRYPEAAVSEAEVSTTPKTTPKTTREVLLDHLKARPDIGRKALAELLGITPDGVKYHLNQLRSAGKIRHIGAARGGHWEVLK